MTRLINPISLENVKYAAKQFIEGGGNVTYCPKELIKNCLWVIETLEKEVELDTKDVQRLSVLAFNLKEPTP